MLAILGGLADVERDLIRTRTAEGRSRAKTQGKHMGRPPSLTPAQQKEAIRRRTQGATLDELARSYKCEQSHDFPSHSVGSTNHTHGTRFRRANLDPRRRSLPLAGLQPYDS